MEAPLVCPHCPNRPLFEGARGTVKLHGCGVCGGVWIGNELAARLLQQLEPDAVALADQAAGHGMPFPQVSARPACPVCGVDLRRITVHGTRTELDLCDAHGTWFDRDELQSVSHFFEERRRAQVAAAQNFPPPMRYDERDYDAYLEKGKWRLNRDDSNDGIDIGTVLDWLSD
ncbi:zf-TFIIB domain-containing protein [Pendulispora rubella]|uniref:Zf-TFIIB domain-containing protein n=1 Tax=Pendulispora rubella TaxID=2741070 RepID=A0ABZ2L3Q6_9BACT